MHNIALGSQPQRKNSAIHWGIILDGKKKRIRDGENKEEKKNKQRWQNVKGLWEIEKVYPRQKY